MARVVNKLSPLKISKLEDLGRYGDGGGLWLQVSQWGTKAWIFRFMMNGQARQMGLGPYPDVGLAEARDLAAAARRSLREGIDPIEARRQRRPALPSIVHAESTPRKRGLSASQSRQDSPILRTLPVQSDRPCKRSPMTKSTTGELPDSGRSESPRVPVRFLRIAEVISLTCLPRSTLYEQIGEGSFPKPVRLSPRLVGWVADEVAAWQAAKMAERARGVG